MYVIHVGFSSTLTSHYHVSVSTGDTSAHNSCQSLLKKENVLQNTALFRNEYKKKTETLTEGISGRKAPTRGILIEIFGQSQMSSSASRQ